MTPEVAPQEAEGDFSQNTFSRDSDALAKTVRRLRIALVSANVVIAVSKDHNVQKICFLIKMLSRNDMYAQNLKMFCQTSVQYFHKSDIYGPVLSNVLASEIFYHI